MNSEIWVVDDDSSMRWVVEKALDKAGYRIRGFEDGESLLKALDTRQPDLVISDIRMPGIGGFELLEQINQRQEKMPVIIMTAYGDLDSAVDSYKYGAYEYLTKPFDIDVMLEIVSRALADTLPAQKPRTSTAVPSGGIIGESAIMQEVFRVIGRIAGTRMSVLIRGESGTGKELVAQAIHDNSPRRARPLVAINTAAIPAELLESELFGHEKGAFTGAHSQHIGRFEQAHLGTLFLDEIGDMPAALQTRLLRVLSEGRFYRVGGRQEVNVDVRIIAATNQDLDTLVEQGKFRNDLFHRLNVLSLKIPPLRHRGEDILLLASHFLDTSRPSSENSPKTLSVDVTPILQSYNWPGNVRELENLVQQLSILSVGSRIELSDVPDHIRNIDHQLSGESWKTELQAVVSRKLRLGETRVARSLNQEVEAILIEAALKHTGGHKQKAARLLGWGRNTLTRKLGQDSPG